MKYAVIIAGLASIPLTAAIVVYGPDSMSGTYAVEQPGVPAAAATHIPLVPAPSQIALDECLSLNHTTGEYGPCGMPATWWECMDESLGTYDSMAGRTSPSVDRARGVLDWNMMVCDRLFPAKSPDTGQTAAVESPANGPDAEPHQVRDTAMWLECANAALERARDWSRASGDDVFIMTFVYDLAVCDRLFSVNTP